MLLKYTLVSITVEAIPGLSCACSEVDCKGDVTAYIYLLDISRRFSENVPRNCETMCGPCRQIMKQRREYLSTANVTILNQNSQHCQFDYLESLTPLDIEPNLANLSTRTRTTLVEIVRLLPTRPTQRLSNH